MQGRKGRVFIELQVDDKGSVVVKKFEQNVDKSFDKVKADVGSAGSAMDKFKQNWLGITAAAGVAYLAFNKAKAIVNDLTLAYGTQEAAIAELEASLKSTGIFLPELSRDLQQLASDMQKLTKYGDETQESAMALLQSLGRLDGEGLKKVWPSVLDLAAGLKIDLATAANLVGKTLGTSMNALTRYGVEIDATATKGEKLTQLQEQIAVMFGGRAQVDAATYTGQMAQLGNVWGDLKESGGALLAVALLPMARVMKSIIENLNELTGVQIKAKEELKAGSDLQIQVIKNTIKQYELLKTRYELEGKSVAGINALLNEQNKILGELEEKKKSLKPAAIEDPEKTIKRLEAEKANITRFLNDITLAEKAATDARTEYKKEAAAWETELIKFQSDQQMAAWESASKAAKAPEKAMVDYKDAVDQAAFAINNLFTIMELDSRNSANVTLKAFGSIINAIPAVIAQYQALAAAKKAADTAGMAASGFGLLGIGLGLIGGIASMVTASREGRDEPEPAQDMTNRTKFAAVSQQGPKTVVFNISNRFEGENLFVGPGGIAEAGDAMSQITKRNLEELQETGGILVGTKGA